MEVGLLLGLDDLVNIPGDEFYCLVIPVLNFALSLQIKGQLEDSLFLGVAEFFTGKAFIIMLKTHTIEFLSKFTIFEFRFETFYFFFGWGGV